jgi:uncharacterized membrane protein YeiB
MYSINAYTNGRTIPPISLPSSRLAGIDLARAIALMGMVFVNFKYQMGADQDGVPWLLWLSDWLDGRPAATFVILAGAGMSLLKNCYSSPDRFHPFARPYWTMIKRAVFLFFFGLLFSLIWYADILHFYGFFFAVAVILVNLSDRLIFILSGVILIISLFVAIHFNFSELPSVESVWDPVFWTQRGFFEDLLINGSYPVFPWMVYFMLGIWLGRQNLSDSRLQNKILLIAGPGIVFCELIAWFAGSFLDGSSILFNLFLISALIDTSPFSLSSLSVFSASGTALVIIVLSIKLAKQSGPSRWLRPFLATARMSLTLYILHIGVFQLFLILSGLGERENSLLSAWVSAAMFCISAMLFSCYWVNRFGQGPLEKVLRWLSK